MASSRPSMCGPGRRMRPRRPARIRRTGKARMHPDRKSVRKVRADRQGVNMHRKPCPALQANDDALFRSEEHTSELQSIMRISYADFCLKKKKEPDTDKHN